MMNWCLHTLQTNSKVTCDGIGIGYLTPYVDWYIVRMKFCQVQFEPKLVSLRSVEYCNFTPDFSNIFQLSVSGNEFPRRLCDPLPPVTPVLYYRRLAAGLHDKIISQGQGVTESTWEFVTLVFRGWRLFFFFVANEDVLFFVVSVGAFFEVV